MKVVLIMNKIIKKNKTLNNSLLETLVYLNGINCLLKN